MPKTPWERALWTVDRQEDEIQKERRNYHPDVRKRIEDSTPLLGEPEEGDNGMTEDELLDRLETDLRLILGPTYGGPSLSYEDGKFVIYSWGDAPVGMDPIAESVYLDEVVELAKDKERRHP
jgi:hypothetical protein